MFPSPEKRVTGGRVALALTAVVKAKETHDHYWKETTDLVSVSRSGAGFYLTRPCDVGQLVSLIFAMPKHLRAYDQDKELFRVWGLVQHSNAVYGGWGAPTYHVGVALIGRHVPQSYHENPRQSYRIAGMQPDGMWRVIESKAGFVVRRHPRYMVSLPFTLSALDQSRNIVLDEFAATANISSSGAAVLTTLDADVGESVRVECDKYGFASAAVVRHRVVKHDSRPTLHLEFLDAAFPVDRVPTNRSRGIGGID